MDPLTLRSLRRYLLEQELMFLAGEPVVYHCHHYNLALDQTIEDALGPKKSMALRTRAAREFSHRILRAVSEQAGAETPPERLQLASEIFRAFGHGRLDLNADAKGGTARGEFLHYGYSWFEKYGAKVKRREPADAFATGFAAAAVEVAYDLPEGTIYGEETECLATRSSSCLIRLSVVDEPKPQPVEHVNEAATTRAVGAPEDGLNEDIIQPIAQGLKEFTAGVSGDERGLVQAFGVFVTLHLAGYYNRISFDMIEEIAESAPQSVGVAEDLLREAAHLCVFNTFGGILLSPEWEGMVGPLEDNPEKIVSWCMAIARGLGFGRWTVAEFEPNKRFVMRASGSYESVYYRTRHGVADRPVEYLLQGAALATAQLAHRVKWTERPQLSPEYYQQLFKGGVPWQFEQTQSLVCGDPISEVVVTLK